MFIAALRGVLGGLPLGAALGPINAAAASLSAELREQLANREVIVDKAAFLQKWIAERDARGYSLFGDIQCAAPRSALRHWRGGKAMLFCSGISALNQLKDEGYGTSSAFHAKASIRWMC